MKYFPNPKTTPPDTNMCIYKKALIFYKTFIKTNKSYNIQKLPMTQQWVFDSLVKVRLGCLTYLVRNYV